MDLVTSVLELMTSMLALATKPLSLIRILCVLGVRNLCVVIQTWIEILRAAISTHFSIIWQIVSWTYAIISLPSRVVFALQRESLLQSQLYELQIEMEKLLWCKKELQVRLQKAIREFRMMEKMLAEVEDEHEEAIVEIEQLESKLKNKREENLLLKEVHAKLQLAFQSADDSPKTKNPNNVAADKSNVSSGTRQWEPENSTGTEPKYSPLAHKVARDHTLYVNTNEFLSQRALLQSIFSSLLSVLVGMIIWEAEDPCMPLVVALFSVVGISLKSVVQFFSTITNKPAYDAAALLCLNWFILGALTYPTLPKAAHMLRHRD